YVYTTLPSPQYILLYHHNVRHPHTSTPFPYTTLFRSPKEQYIRAQKAKRKLLHNCAGKHLGFLAYAKEKGLSLDTYTDPKHPLRSEEHTSELQSRFDLVCRLLLEKKKKNKRRSVTK